MRSMSRTRETNELPTGRLGASCSPAQPGTTLKIGPVHTQGADTHRLFSRVPNALTEDAVRPFRPHLPAKNLWAFARSAHCGPSSLSRVSGRRLLILAENCWPTCRFYDKVCRFHLLHINNRACIHEICCSLTVGHLSLNSLHLLRQTPSNLSRNDGCLGEPSAAAAAPRPALVR